MRTSIGIKPFFMMEQLSREYENLIRGGSFDEAIDWCDQHTTGPFSGMNLTDLSVATHLIRAKVTETTDNLPGIRDTFRREIGSLLAELRGDIPETRKEHLQRQIPYFLEAKAVLDLILEKRWSIARWKADGLGKALSFWSAIDEGEPMSGYEEYDREESGEHLALNGA